MAAEAFDARRLVDMRVVFRAETREGRWVVTWPDGREIVALRPLRLPEGVLAARGGRLVWLVGAEAEAAWETAAMGRQV